MWMHSEREVYVYIGLGTASSGWRRALKHGVGSDKQQLHNLCEKWDGNLRVA